MEKMGEKRQKNYLPWNIPFEYRLKQLCCFHRSGFYNAVYLYETADTSTFRYRVYNMCQSLGESAFWRGSYFFENELERLRNYIQFADLIVLARFHWTEKLGDFIFYARSLHKKILFDVDDLVFEIKYFPELLESIGLNRKSEAEVSYWQNYVSGLNHTALMCDAGITTNGYLKKFLGETMQKDCYVVPNTFNTWQEEISNECYEVKREEAAKRADRRERNEFILGYFSGSHTHEKDFAGIAEELRDLLRAIPEMKLRIVGYMKIPAFMHTLTVRKKIEFLPFQNFIELQKTIAEVDVNLVPLADTIFTNSKSELKYFEASIAGTISCMSPTYVYRKNVRDGSDGFLCRDGGWYETIMDLYGSRLDEGKIRQEAHDACVRRYRYSAVRNKIEDCFDEMR